MEIIFTRKPVNTRQLEIDLRAVFAERYTGLSSDSENIIFYLDKPTDEDVQIIRALYEAHTPTETDDERETRKRSNRTALRAFIRNYSRTEIRSLVDLLPYIEALFFLVADED